MSNPETDMIDRRQHFRIDMEDEAVDLLWCDNEGQSHKVKSVCADFSKGGLRIEHNFPIVIGTQVSFKFQAEHPESKALSAEVIRCFELSNGSFSIGFQTV
ncbi:PilZ domain-containing protein [Colwelliaceae bacterium BS250]